MNNRGLVNHLLPTETPWPNELESTRKIENLGLLATFTCVDLRSLWSKSQQSKQGFHRLATQPKSTQVECSQ